MKVFTCRFDTKKDMKEIRTPVKGKHLIVQFDDGTEIRLRPDKGRNVLIINTRNNTVHIRPMCGNEIEIKAIEYGKGPFHE